MISIYMYVYKKIKSVNSFHVNDIGIVYYIAGQSISQVKNIIENLISVCRHI